MIDAFLPRDKVYLPELDSKGVVTKVQISSDGIEYLVRYIKEECVYEGWFYDFEVKKQSTVNA